MSLIEAEDLLTILTHIANQKIDNNFSFGADWSLLRNYPYLQEELLCPMVMRIGYGPFGKEYFFGSSSVRDFDRINDLICLLELEIAATKCL